MNILRTFIPFLLASVMFAGASLAEPEEQVCWREQYAYSVGMAAYPYTLPYLFNSQLRWMWTNPERDPG